MGTAVADSTEATAADDAAVAESTAETTASTESTEAKTMTLTTDASTESTETTEAEKPVEISYDLKLPENSVLDETAIERTVANARKQGLSSEAAQSQLEFLNTEVAQRETAFLESNKPGGAEWTTRVNTWEGQALKDPEIGGTPEKLQETVAVAKRVLSEVFPPSVAAFLHETGYGSHPDIIKGLAKIGKMTSEGSFIPGNSTVTPQKTDAEKMYDHPDNYKHTESTT